MPNEPSIVATPERVRLAGLAPLRTIALGALLGLLALAAPASAESGPVSLTADFNSGRTVTRVVLSLTDYVPYAISQPPGKLLIRFQSPRVAANFDLVDVGDGALESITYFDDARRPTVTLNLGSEFRAYQPIVLKDPFRVVIDLTRRTPWDGTSRRHQTAPETPPKPEPRGAAELEQAVEREIGGPVAPRTAPELEGAAGLELHLGPVGNGERGGRIRTVVLDPGHGGPQVGAKGPGGLLEKDVTLAIGLKLKSVLEGSLGLQVVLTRTDDRELDLDERTAMANNHKADLFISIHANASSRPDARGAETYFLSREATSEETIRLAAIENDALGVSDPSIAGTDLELILWDLAQVQYLRESEALGEAVQAEMNDLLGIKDRGVKQAPFRVLMAATMPAVLVEVAFLSNPQEGRLLGQEEFQGKVATALYQSVLRFMQNRERRMGVATTAH